MMLSTFAKNTAIGFALPAIYDKFFDAYIKNKTLKQQLKLNLFLYKIFVLRHHVNALFAKQN